MSVEDVRKETGYAAGDGKEKENPCTLHIFFVTFLLFLEGYVEEGGLG